MASIIKFIGAFLCTFVFDIFFIQLCGRFYINMKNTKVTPPIHLDEDDYDFIVEYKLNKKVRSFQDFIREAVSDKIKHIETIEQLNNLDKLK